MQPENLLASKARHVTILRQVNSTTTSTSYLFIKICLNV